MKRLFAGIATLIVGAVAGNVALAQAFPVKPVRLVVAFAPGGATDTFSRVTAAEMSKNMGQQVLVENRPGAGTTIAAEFIAKSPA
ncbi:MAG: tripartite tricarboxylate transporter substrate-binding protein, partial [Terriglobales bacterium]